MTANDRFVPEHNAVNEATIAAVFAHLEAMIEIEIDLAANERKLTETDDFPGPRFVCGVDYPSVRQLLAEAVGEDECDEYGRPDPTSGDMQMWRAMVERAEERIFWDHDFEWHDPIVWARALATLGAEPIGEYAFEVSPPSAIPTASILRGFDTMRWELQKEWEAHRSNKAP